MSRRSNTEGYRDGPWAAEDLAAVEEASAEAKAIVASWRGQEDATPAAAAAATSAAARLSTVPGIPRL